MQFKQVSGVTGFRIFLRRPPTNAVAPASAEPTLAATLGASVRQAPVVLGEASFQGKAMDAQALKATARTGGRLVEGRINFSGIQFSNVQLDRDALNLLVDLASPGTLDLTGQRIAEQFFWGSDFVALSRAVKPGTLDFTGKPLSNFPSIILVTNRQDLLDIATAAKPGTLDLTRVFPFYSAEWAVTDVITLAIAAKPTSLDVGQLPVTLFQSLDELLQVVPAITIGTLRMDGMKDNLVKQMSVKQAVQLATVAAPQTFDLTALPEPPTTLEDAAVLARASAWGTMPTLNAQGWKLKDAQEKEVSPATMKMLQDVIAAEGVNPGTLDMTGITLTERYRAWPILGGWARAAQPGTLDLTQGWKRIPTPRGPNPHPLTQKEFLENIVAAVKSETMDLSKIRLQGTTPKEALLKFARVAKPGTLSLALVNPSAIASITGADRALLDKATTPVTVATTVAEG